MFEVYKNFELITIDPPFTNLKWRRQFSRAGEFQLETFFSPEKWVIFAEGNVLYKRDVDEAAFIEQRSVIQDADENMILIVSGRMIQSLLDRRVMSIVGEFTLTNFLTQIINKNFMSGAEPNRQISELVLLPSSLPYIIIKADFRMTNVLDNISEILEENFCGMKMFYNIKNKSYDLKFIESVETEVVFSREFANIIEQDYTDNITNYKNVVYVGEQGKFIYGNENKGLSRREIQVSSPTAEESEYLLQTALNALLNNSASKTLSNVINPYSKQYEYLNDWNIGSIVYAKNIELGYAEQELITEITEVYDETGLNLEVNLGDYKKRQGVTVSQAGTQGATGLQGEQGTPGVQGVQGEKGERGEQGIQGERGLEGQDGFSPTIKIAEETTTVYKLNITDINGTFTTPNLKGQGSNIGTHRLECVIPHNQNRYPFVQVIKITNGTGIGGAGETPAGGSNISEVAKWSYIDKNNIDVYVADDYGDCELIKISDTEFNIVFADNNVNESYKVILL